MAQKRLDWNDGRYLKEAQHDNYVDFILYIKSEK